MRRIWSFLEYLNESNNSCDYWGGMDVTKMPIIANVRLKIGDLEPDLVPIVAILGDDKDLLFVTNAWYKDRPTYKQPYLYPSDHVDEIYWEKWKKIK